MLAMFLQDARASRGLPQDVSSRRARTRVAHSAHDAREQLIEEPGTKPLGELRDLRIAERHAVEGLEVGEIRTMVPNGPAIRLAKGLDPASPPTA
jgi:hypothetical protein